jgi:hypothetical protein
LGNEITTARAIPSPTPQIAKSLSRQERIDHREKIAFEVKTVLSAYFQPHEAEEIRAAQLAWWCDELQDWTREQVVWGLRQWNRSNPDKRPTPGHILALLIDTRGRKEAERMQAIPKPQEPARELPSEERRLHIMAEVQAAADRLSAGRSKE